MYKIFNHADVERLSAGVCDVLEKVGFQCENRPILSAYQNAGAVVDFDTHTAKFPRKVITDFVETVRKEDKTGWGQSLHKLDQTVIYSGFIPYEKKSEFKAPDVPFMFHNLSTYFYDDEKKERRLGNRNDFITLIKLGDALHPQDGVGHALNLAADTPPEVEPLEAALTLLEYSQHPTGVYVQDIRQIPYLEEIEAIFGISDPYWHWMANICPTSPLKLDKLAAERYVTMLQSGLYPAKLAAMPVSGVNIPVTVAGSVVVVAAEFVALWLAARLLVTRKVPLVGLPILGTMDLRKGAVSFTAFDAAMRRLAVCDFVKQWMGVQLAPGPGEWPPTKEPGLYCTLEKAYYALLATTFTGHHPDIGVGHIDSGLTISPVQLLLDREFSKGLQHLEPPRVNTNDLGLEAILEVGFGGLQNYMGIDHTLDRIHGSLWNPDYFSRIGGDPAGEQDVMNRALKQVRQLIGQYQKPAGHETKLAKARTVLEKAKEDLCGK